MDGLLQEIIPYLQRLGPVVVLVVTATETAFFIGLLIPAEPTVLLAAFMADLGYFELSEVLAATLAGGFLGDQIGYLLGRTAGRRAVRGTGRVARLWAKHEPRAQRLFGRRTIVAVSLARFISFVRTIMPWTAGMSGMSWPRFLAYDLIGVLGWGTASVAAGYFAGRSWEVLAGALGTFSAVVVVLLIAVPLVMAMRRRRAARAAIAAGDEPTDPGPAEA